MVSLVERYAKRIAGVLSCFDRLLITGTLPGICYSEGMASYLAANGVRIFDYPRFVEPMRDEIRANAEQMAREKTTLKLNTSARPGPSVKKTGSKKFSTKGVTIPA